MLDLNAMRAAKAEVSEWLRTSTMAGMPTADRIVERACVAYAAAICPTDVPPMQNDTTSIAPR